MAAPFPDNGNDTSTGGFLVPLSPSLEDDELDDVLQTTLVGVTVLPPSLVKPAYAVPTGPGDTVVNFQRPEPYVNWAAFAVTSANVISSKPAITHDGSAAGGTGLSTVTPQELVEVLASFYGPRGQFYAKLARDGLKVDQNRWLLRAAGLALVEVSDLTAVPVIGEDVNQQTQRRYDVTLKIARPVPKTYAVRNIRQAITDVRYRQAPAPARDEHRETPVAPEGGT